MDSRDGSQPRIKRERDEDDIVTEAQQISKEERRRISNREFARKSRAQKKARLEDLHQTVEHQAAMLASFEHLQIQYEREIQTLLTQHTTHQTDITNLQAEVTNLQAELEQFETTTYNPLTGCYSRGTKIGFDLHPMFFFKQEDKQQDTLPIPGGDDELPIFVCPALALDDADAPLPPIKDDEIYFPTIEFGKY